MRANDSELRITMIRRVTGLRGRSNTIIYTGRCHVIRGNVQSLSTVLGTTVCDTSMCVGRNLYEDAGMSSTTAWWKRKTINDECMMNNTNKQKHVRDA